VTGNVRVSFVSLETRADWSMVLDEAVGIGTAVARVAAHPVDAGLGAGTVRVGRAARRDGQQNWVAFTVGIGHPSLRASTGHRSQRHRVQHHAPGS
jgi:hypothetical protein